MKTIRPLKVISIVTALILLCQTMSACGFGKFKGTYENLRSTRTYVFKYDKDNSGTFEMYDDGEKVGNSNMRYINTWNIQDNVLTLTRNHEVWAYYKVYADVLVAIDDVDEEPDMWEYIAPKGKTFNWKYNGYEFFENGTVSKNSSSYYPAIGNYYVEDNIIFVKLRYTSSNIIYQPEPEYEPLFYIYNGDSIIWASKILLKK